MLWGFFPAGLGDANSSFIVELGEMTANKATRMKKKKRERKNELWLK